MKIQFLENLNKLKILTRELESNLENLKHTNQEAGIAKIQFFQHNLKHIQDACQSLLRGDPTEKPLLRLEKELPNTLKNLQKIKNSDQAKNNQELITQIKQLINYLQQNYKNL